MRIRSTKPEFWRSKTIAALPWDVRLVLKGLESYVDDNGVGKDDIALIAADVFPRDLSASPPETLARLTEAISRLSNSGLIARYDVDGENLLYIDKWKDLQRIDKPGRGRFPRPDGTLEYGQPVDRDTYRKPRDTLASPPETVAPVTGEQGNRGAEEKTPSSSAPPPREDVESLCTHLHRRITDNGGRATISAKWRTEARLLIDNDGVDPEQAHRLIDWCQDDSFWHANILSMPKFREKYQQLLLKARVATRPAGRDGNGLTPRQMEIANAELLKENPDEELLRRAGLLPAQPQLRAINGGH
ncbi:MULTISPECIES: hypothetical protein [unclassified Rhodococcus (in: high G+C Gram-positive bacteria)]|uniref:hypothetical protein n=1 Tax=unclassified Rhodococcus (in: high G+C Gram-positive bacteria) TaxID=192944 RepID=UPI0006FFB1D8|nr:MULTISPECIES: hypothetical protein [unclassified Rhodococcus (in: high G+C Gram-positive bacteria)]KQU30324.1 hypothetical protein ASG69_04505 [Rhodococcus sp. Leaf225]KQU44771.1 hypothetical protein ASH03_12635 [Rhodococcus sp. Leaf258]